MIHQSPIRPANQASNKATTSSSSKSVGHLSNYGQGTPAASLTEGQVIKGEITDLRNNEITITLEDNTKVTGFVKDGSDYSIGETHAFRITELSPKGIYLEVVTSNKSASENITIQKALEAANLPKTEKNKQIVKELLNNKMAINKQSIQSILKQTYLFKNASIKTLVLMTKHQIPFSQANVTQFEHYQNYEHRLAKEVEQTVMQLPDFFSELSLKQDGIEQAARLLHSFTAYSKPIAQVSEVFSFSEESAKQELLTILGNYSVPEEIIAQIKIGEGSLSSIYKAIALAYQQAEEFDNENIREAKDAFLLEHPELSMERIDETLRSSPENYDYLLDQLEETLNNVPSTTDLFDTQVIHQIRQAYEKMQMQKGEIGASLSNKERSELLQLLEGFPIQTALKEKLQDGDGAVKELLTVLKNVLPITPKLQAVHLLSSPVFHKIIKQNFIHNWTLTPDDLKQEHSVEELYSRIYKQTEDILAVIKENRQELTSSLFSQASNIRENIDFMQLMNQMFSYVQLPLNLKGKQIHSELYVYTKKADLKKKGAIHVLLHLDMDYLGTMDIQIELNNQMVSSKFYLQKEESISLLKANEERLTQALKAKQYTVVSEFLLQEKKVDLVKDFMEMDVPNTSMKRFTFDIRA